MKYAEMLVLAATAIALAAALRLASTDRAKSFVVGTFIVCGLIYISYRKLRAR